ncbi:hypothetical protein C0584_05620, partial [Candidatus Parcubacteria bacterium]
GSVYFVFANPRAIEKNIRFTEKNLNRCFISTNTGDAYEDNRARELMRLLDECDALLDLHSSISSDTKPFIITDNGLELSAKMNFELIATGFDTVEPGGSDGYMLNNKKIGLCLECGYLGASSENSDLAYDSIVQFLQHYNSIEKINSEHEISQKVVHVDEVQIVTDDSFQMTRSFADFETVPAGTVLARDDKNEYKTTKERVVIFGSAGKPVGAEAYILGDWQK